MWKIGGFLGKAEDIHLEKQCIPLENRNIPSENRSIPKENKSILSENRSISKEYFYFGRISPQKTALMWRSIMKKKYGKILNLIIAIALMAGVVLTDSTISRAVERDSMEVHFIDVGQGDSTLITCGEHAMLIDAGDDSKGTAIQNYLQKRKITKLDYLILTHPDADHIGGAPVIVTKFDIDKVFMSNYEKDNKTYRKLIQALDDKRMQYVTPETGSHYSLGRASFTVLAPNDEYDNPNDASIALLVKNGSTKFLFTGDAGQEAEEDILDTGIPIAADVYKVGHHGSKYSTSKDFFRAVRPDYAVISCAEDNSYGHPHAETLNTLRTNRVKVYRTDEAGTIVAVSDGRNITFSVPESDTWKAGKPADSSDTSIKESPKSDAETQKDNITYVINKNTQKFHLPDCSSVGTIREKNREDTTQSREEVIRAGYVPCKRCKP